MKFIYLIVFYCCFFFNNSNAQETLNSTGADVSNSSGSFNYSIGQLVYSVTEGSSGIINEGVQQPFEIFTTGISLHTKTNLKFNLYPNPTSNSINLHTNILGNETLYFRLTDHSGRTLLKNRISNTETTIEMREFAPGYYILIVETANHRLQTFKITKN